MSKWVENLHMNFRVEKTLTDEIWLHRIFHIPARCQ